MAFLDFTDRSYGTADVLADLKIVSGGWGGGDYEPTFLRVLKETNGDDKTRPLWTYLKVVSLQDAPDPETESLDEYGMLELKVPDDQTESVTSLYNLWDLLYWIDPGTSDAEDEEPAKMAYVTEAPEVLTMRINGAVSSIDIPETFYLDRYMESNKWKAATIQTKICRVHRALAKAKEVENRITKWISPQDGKEWDRTMLINKVIERDEKEIRRVKALALWRKHEECNASDDPFPYLPHLPAQLDDLVELNEQEETVLKHYEAHIDIHKQKLADIERKLNRLKAEKTACLELLQRLNEKLTVPTGDVHWNPVHDYSLRGVAASPDVVYICRRAEPDLIDMEGGNAAPIDQWWKLAYVADDADPIKVEKTQIETVLRVALTESEDKKPILVYASKKALAEEPSRISQPLQLFVRFDNRLFKQEVIEESPLERKRGANASPQSPFKRQHRDRANSVDSMASNRASVGDLSDEDRNVVFDQDPFQEGDGSLGTEMQPLIDMTDLSAQSAPVESSEPPKSEVYGHARLPTPPYTTFDSEVDSPTLSRQSLRLANVSLDEQSTITGTESQAREPEMQERNTSNFLARSDKRSVDNRASIMDMDMEIPSEFEHHRTEGKP
ncbi:putative ubiquitin interaction motif protein [Phaeoacremonium minimum UCRPA7]|uniref:Putative ubiquitin interaction motif protein n=1 Tax=Phaeoacremonium minimum (strain UCR-PA7) TaxID=1286976 RepID=R8BH99_PHAM7|nr:putative ubiquitin interaction motif protein [Phaeoacremonium minimum UCRPA7]EON98617.1 putative ubiquitin interaction motif protein [Phaeoacremonium minimum UCRPA7]